MYVAAKHPAIGAVAVVVEHDRVVTQDQVVAVVIDLGIAADGCEVVHHVRCDFVVIALDEMDAAMELLEDHGSIVRIPKHIAKDIDIITVGNNIVPTLDEVIIHLFNGLIGTLLEPNNVPMREMQVCDVVVHLDSSFLSLK